MMQMFIGCVEDIADPEKMGRVRVRVVGVHTPVKNQGKTDGIPTDHLPWANPAWPINGTGPTGIGDWKPPVQGSWVYLFPLDEGLQRWVYFATASGFPLEKSDPSMGFNDPDGEYPIQERIGEPDYNRLAANREIEKTIIQNRRDEAVTDIPVASVALPGTTVQMMREPVSVPQTYNEPREPYAAEYPQNRVIETDPGEYKFGHVIELDDTDASPRIHIEHKNGSSLSIHGSGQTVFRSVGDNYDVIFGNQFTFFRGDEFHTVWGDERVLVRSNALREVYGYDRTYIKGSQVTYVSGDVSEFVGSPLVDNPQKPNASLTARKKDGSIPELSEKSVPEIAAIGGNKYSKVENNSRNLVKGNRHETVDGTYWIEVTGLRNLTECQVGKQGSMTIEPHGEFMIKGHKMVRMKGGKQFIDYGCVGKFSICPYTLMPHTFPSRTVKITI